MLFFPSIFQVDSEAKKAEPGRNQKGLPGRHQEVLGVPEAGGLLPGNVAPSH